MAHQSDAHNEVTVVARNPRARHDYHFIETMEAGLVLTGSEVKSLREGKASIVEAFGVVRNGEAWLEGMNIPQYFAASQFNHPPVRPRKLLLHRRQINRLVGSLQRKGLTVIPLELYFRRGRAKVKVALAQGKKKHDRREDIKRREAELEVARSVKRRR